MTRGTIPVMTDEITLRNPRPDELHEFWQPLADAFAESLTKEEIEAERPLLDFDRLIGAFDGAKRVGTAAAYTFRLTVPGGEVGAAGITGVGVRPDYRRRGILRQMMDWLLEDARKRGEPVAVLTASEAAIYQRFGFGQASTASSFTLDTALAEFGEPVDLGDGAQIRMVETDEATELFATIYDRVRPGIPGALDRIEPKWRLSLVADAEWMRRGGQGIKYQSVIEVDGEPRGYAIYRIEHNWGPTGPASTMNVLEVTGVDPAAEQALWQWLLSMDLVRTIVGRRGPVPHPLQHWLLEPRRLSLTINDGLWLRILDLPEALSARRYVGSGSLVLDVADDMFESNTGRWQLNIEDGRAKVTRTKSAPDLELDVGTLAAAYLGGFRFVDLRVAGRVHECQPGVLQTADALFTPPRAPWNSTPF
jgi:predicted acetyltransferase